MNIFKGKDYCFFMANKNSQIEAEFRYMAKQKGYEIYSKGYPDYILIKNGKVIFVECKKPQMIKTKKGGYSKHQIEMRKIFRGLGLTWKTFRGNWKEMGIEEEEK